MSGKEFEAELTLKDRINFPYLLANQILTFQKAILNMEFSEREIREAIEGFVNLIPEAWKDEAFRDEIKKAEKVDKIDIRPEFCGVKASKQFCEDHKIDLVFENKTFDYYKVFQACINLLQRKKMLSRIMRIEELENIDLDNPPEDAFIESNIQTE